ncbi:MAG: replication protein [Cressdnaviricota sp.]|nr:MAG: replication protein [Cressdnaviricota sp.]
MSVKENPAKAWRFTVASATEDDVTHIQSICKEHTSWSIVSRGEQDIITGIVAFKERARFSSVMGNRANFKASSCANGASKKMKAAAMTELLNENVVCLHNMTVPSKEKTPTTHSREELFPWQLELVEILEQPCAWNDRTIYWRHGDVNIGKTQFAKYLCAHHDACVIGGAHRHILAQVQNSDAPIYIVLLSYGDEKVSYRAIEQIKDGLFTSAFGCDNNKMTIRDAPHILIIGNEPPDKEDRNFHPTKYNVKQIGGGHPLAPIELESTHQPIDTLAHQPIDTLAHQPISPCYKADEEDNIVIPSRPTHEASAYCEFTMDTDIPGYTEKNYR